MSYLKTQKSAPQGSGPVANYGGLLTQLMQAMRDARPPNKRGPREGNWTPPDSEPRAKRPSVPADEKDVPEAPGSHRVNAGVGSSQQEALRAVRGKRNRVVIAGTDDANEEEAMKRGGYSRAGGGVGSG